MSRLAASSDLVGIWWKRYASWIAAVLAFSTFVLAVIVGILAGTLYARGWRLALGTVPEAVAAIGTVAALLVAIGVWQHDITTRRADELDARQAKERAELAARQARGDQARLVVIDFMYDVETEMYSGGEWSPMRAIVTNLSDRPIFDVHIDVPEASPEMVLREDDEPVNTPNSLDARAINGGGEHRAHFEHTAKTIDWDWIKRIPFSYTDANGVRWVRTMNSQPVEAAPPAAHDGGRDP